MISLSLHPGAWGLPGPGALQEPAVFQNTLSSRASSLGRGPGLQAPRKVTSAIRGSPLPCPELHTQLSAPLCCPHSPSVSGAGTADEGRRCHRALACARDQLEGRRWGLFETDGSVRFGSGGVCKTHCAWRACRGLGSRVASGGSVWPARPRATHASVTGPVGGPGS